MKNQASSSESDASASELSRGLKRSASPGPPIHSKRVAGHVGGPIGGIDDAGEPDETLCTEFQELLLTECQTAEVSVEALVDAYVNKRASKEIPASGNDMDLQQQVDEAKSVEWGTVTGKNATRLVLGQEAELVRKRFPDRIMGSRFVCTWKQEEDAPRRVKARWCLQGHLDPDLQEKAMAGDLQSPTLSQLGRALLFQVIASSKWQLMLGDIRGAFLSSGELPQRYRPFRECQQAHL